MILSAQAIRRYRPVAPFHERTKYHGLSFGLGPASYDVRIGQTLDIRPGMFLLASTLEEFHLDPDIMGMVCDKSTWARQGIAAQNTIIDPGFIGYLTLELTNHSNVRQLIKVGMPIVQIVFFKLDEETEQPYNGKYQYQKNEPVGATWV